MFDATPADGWGLRIRLFGEILAKVPPRLSWVVLVFLAFKCVRFIKIIWHVCVLLESHFLKFREPTCWMPASQILTAKHCLKSRTCVKYKALAMNSMFHVLVLRRKVLMLLFDHVVELPEPVAKP